MTTAETPLSTRGSAAMSYSPSGHQVHNKQGKHYKKFTHTYRWYIGVVLLYCFRYRWMLIVFGWTLRLYYTNIAWSWIPMIISLLCDNTEILEVFFICVTQLLAWLSGVLSLLGKIKYKLMVDIKLSNCQVKHCQIYPTFQCCIHSTTISIHYNKDASVFILPTPHFWYCCGSLDSDKTVFIPTLYCISYEWLLFYFFQICFEQRFSLLHIY